MNALIKGRDGEFHKVNLSWLLIPIVLLIMIVGLWAYRGIATKFYDKEVDGFKQAVMTGQTTYTTKETLFTTHAFERAIWCDPECFMVGSVSYSRSNGYITYYFTYNRLVNNYFVHLAVYKARVQSIVDSMPTGLNDREKVKWFHDYICEHYNYDYAYDVYDGYSMIEDGVGVCNAYAQLMRSLLDSVGIENHTAISDSINHAWNLVKIDGQWLHLDTTWDDMETGITYDYFLIDSAQLFKLSSERIDWYDCDGNYARIDNIKNLILKCIIPIWVVCLLLSLMPVLKVKLFTKRKVNAKGGGLADEEMMLEALKNAAKLPPKQANKLLETYGLHMDENGDIKDMSEGKI